MSYKLLNLSLLSYFFFFCKWMNSIVLSSGHWSFLLLNLVKYWTPLVSFSIYLLYSLALWFPFDTTLYFVILLKFFFHPLFSWLQWTFLWPLWTLYCISNIFSYWNLFVEIYLVLLFEQYSFIYFLWLPALASAHYIKQLPLLVLTDWSCVGDKPWQSAWPELLVVFQIFVIVQDTIFFLVASNWGYTKSHQYPKWEDHSQPQCIGSLKPDHQAATGKHMVRPLPIKIWEMGFFVWSFCANSVYIFIGEVLLCPFKNCFFFYYSHVVLATWFYH